MKRKRGIMDYRLAKKIIKEIAKKKLTKIVALHVMGEPLLHPRFDDIVRLIHDQGLRIFLNTNASLLTSRKITKIANNVDFIVLNIFSNKEELFGIRKAKGINFSTYFERIKNTVNFFASQKGVKSTLLLRYMLNSQQLKINRLNFKKQIARDVNKEQAEILSYWWKYIKEIKLRLKFCINKISENVFFKYTVARLPELKGIEEDFKSSPKRKYYPLTTNIFVVFSEFVNWNNQLSTSILRLKNHSADYCHRIEKDLCVLWDGECTFCCGDFNGVMKLGRVNVSSIEDMLASRPARFIKENNRNNLFVSQLCRECKSGALS